MCKNTFEGNPIVNKEPVIIRFVYIKEAYE